MSQQLRNAFVDILAAPYYKNERAKSGSFDAGHEDAIAAIFSDNGFVEQPGSICPAVNKTVLLEWTDTGVSTVPEQVASAMPLGSFVLQPADVLFDYE